MTGLIIFACILLFFLFLLSLKGTVSVIYDGEVKLVLRVLFLKLKLLPAKEKKRPHSMSAKKAEKIKRKLEAKERKKQEKKASKKKKKAAAKAEEVKKEKKSLADILDIVALVCKLVKQVIGKFFGHLRIKLARIKIKIGTGDAAATAIAYGAVTQGINVLFPLLEGVKNFSFPENSDIDISADFEAEESEIDICISFSLRVWHLFHIAFAALGEVIRYFFKKLKRKG